VLAVLVRRMEVAHGGDTQRAHTRMTTPIRVRPTAARGTTTP
jgi:hypothetical protein